MSNKEEITIRLSKLKEYLAILEELRSKKTLDEFKKDKILQGALERYLQLSAEASIDIGEIIISEMDFRSPEFNKDVFEILGEEKIISNVLAERLAQMSKFRNILVHDYIEVDLDKVYKYLKKDIIDFEEYIKQIARFVKKQK